MIGAVIAMNKEAAPALGETIAEKKIISGGAEITVGTLFGEKIAVAVSGVGKCNAAAAAAALLASFPVTALLNFGLAGAVNRSLRALDVRPVRRAAQYDFDLTELNGTPLGTLDERTSPWFDLASPAENAVSLGTADRFSGDPKEAAFLRSFGADLRDMEGAAIAQVAEKYGVPLLMWKVVSDVEGVNAPEEYAENAPKAVEKLKETLPAMIAAAKSAGGGR